MADQDSNNNKGSQERFRCACRQLIIRLLLVVASELSMH